ncbi:MAG: hypothetical protein ACOYMN_15220 [Roseimicrobium sp.]
MKITTDELAAMEAEAHKLCDRLHELTGCSTLLLIEIEKDNGEFGIRRFRRGSPYATVRMAQIYAQHDNNEDLASELSRNLQPPPDDSESWKTKE